MRVFHAGITAPTYSSEAIVEAFAKVFGVVKYFNWQESRYLNGVDGMRNELIATASAYNPDLIFLHFNHSSEIVLKEHYESLSKIAKVVCYTEDVREDISHFENISAVVNRIIFTNQDDVTTLILKGIKNVSYLPVSYNHIWYKKQPKTERNYGDIVFIGNNYVNTNLDFPQAKERQEMIKAMKAEFGDKFQAYGLGQENPMLNPQQAVECYNNSLIAITHNNFVRTGYQSDRGLNAIGCGCATIMHWYPDVENQFPFYVWENPKQLIYRCQMLLNYPKMIQALAEYQYSTVEHFHRWETRAEVIKQLVNG